MLSPLRSRLCQRIALAAFFAILVAEIVILLALPSLSDSFVNETVSALAIALAGAAFMMLRKRPQTDAGQQRNGFLDRLLARPSPRAAFVSGVLLFAPGATFIAAVQVVATSDASVPVIVLALVLVVAITALVVWLPLVGYLAAPEATSRRLAVLNGWLRTHGRMVVSYALGVAGAVLIVNGALGLTGVY